MKTATRLWVPFLAVAAAVAGLARETGAYDPETGHEPLTRVALALYLGCVRDSVYAGREDLLVRGNRWMDDGASWWQRLPLHNGSVFALSRRAFNWHFYHPGESEAARAGLVDQSQERLWERLLEGFERNRGEARLLFLGGVLHLVEDVSVPAHVVPVYHGPTAVRWLGPLSFPPLVESAGDRAENGVIKDPIDSFPIADDVREPFELPGLCARIAETRREPSEIRERLARLTLSEVDQPIPRCEGVRWGTFWHPPENGSYFGRYNVGPSVPAFGEAGELGDEFAGCTLADGDARYRAFVRRLQIAAVQADLELLHWGEQQLRSEPTPGR